jgi:glucose/arabinose dehydrogenase
VAALALTAGVARAQQATVTEVWKNECASCHGDKGQGASAPSLLTEEKFLEKHDRPFFDAIRNGPAGVQDHAFGGKKTNPEVWSLVVHLRELQRDDRNSRRPATELGKVYTSAHGSYKVEPVVDKGLKTPWSVEFIPGPLEGMLVTNRGGALMLWRGGTLTRVEGTPKSQEVGQGGLMDVEAHPNFKENGWVYLAFADPGSGVAQGKTMTRVVRGHLKAEGGKVLWTDQQDIFTAKPEHYINSGVHFGCKIAFDPKDPSILFFGIGERGSGQHAQDLKRPNGKIHRVKDDGTIPSDNPFVSVKDAYPSIWSYGHRNPQGLRFDLAGNLWDTEHAPRGGDECNLVKMGKNYGWPIVTFGIDYGDRPISVPWIELATVKGEKPQVEMPVHRWLPSIAVCGLGVDPGTAFPGWKGDLLAGGLAGSVVDRLRMKVENGVGTMVEQETIVSGMGRVRDVTPGPDGTIYVVLNEPDRIVRIVPAK